MKNIMQKSNKFQINSTDDRISNVFEKLKENNKKAFIPFITAGFPDTDRYIELFLTLSSAGADIIEIGIPFSDPMADGPVIQTASNIALKKGINTDIIFDSILKIRSKSETPIAFMTYFNIVLRFGIENFLLRSRETGVDGIIIPDLPLEEFYRYKYLFEKYNMCTILMVSLNTSMQRMKEIADNSRGFLYCVSAKGVTGERSEMGPEVKRFLSSLKRITDLPLCIGFGISNLNQVIEIKDYCDGIIIGSKISSIILNARTFHKGIKEAGNFAAGIIKVLKNQ
jgi:tryptophan synthase, alpha subunit